VLERREARLAGELEDVAWVRHTVAEWLRGWSLAVLVEDVELVASELTTNAILHAGGAVDVVLERRGTGVRVVVHDMRPDVVPARPVQLPLGDGDDEEDGDLDRLARSLFERTTTGRGLLLVQAFAETWGVEVGDLTKGVWADLGTGRPPEVAGEASAPTRSGERQAEAPEAGGRPVQLLDVPVRLILLSAANMDELVRELQTTDFEDAAPIELALLGEHLARATAAHREPLRAAARAAMERRQETVDLALVVAPPQVEVLRRFLDLTGQVERYCREGTLISGAPTSEVTAFRGWYIDEIAGQLAGRPASPCPFPA